jgi:hypothetical protein
MSGKKRHNERREEVNEEDNVPQGETEFTNKVELRLASMRDAGTRMKQDMARAPRKDRPRRYADSAINDAESAMAWHLEQAREGLNQMDDEGRPATLREQVDEAETRGEEIVKEAREDAEERWPVPMD